MTRAIYPMIGIAIADAYGAQFEFTESAHITRHNRAIGYRQHPGRPELPIAAYTDDTQMSIAVAETLIEKSYPYTKDDFLQSFLTAYKRDPRVGYGKRVQRALDQANDLRDLDILLEPKNSKGNGTVMRSVPIGLIQNMQHLLNTAEIQAITTHTDPEAILGSQIIAALAHFAMYHQDSFLEAYKFLYGIFYDRIQFLRSPWVEDSVPCDALKTVHAVFHLLVTHFKRYDTSDNQRNLLMKEAVTLGGDTDSVAAVTAGIASFRVPNMFIHPLLVSGFEQNNMSYGLPFLAEIDARLANKFLI